MDADPVVQVARWYDEARATPAVVQPDAMQLATHSSARTVLLKGIDERGLSFFTNYESRTARPGGAATPGALRIRSGIAKEHTPSRRFACVWSQVSASGAVS